MLLFLGPADHIARFGPARVLAEATVKRGIVDAHECRQGMTPLTANQNGLRAPLSTCLYRFMSTTSTAAKSGASDERACLGV
ncbi:DUF6221 family protein [Streptomyces sp. NBC_01233]|uniref:DUF6221 family protein n=1 Tax=Streptomyces sp. NBC_01233 TaxID=2903787 RepID=UPI003FA371E5